MSGTGPVTASTTATHRGVTVSALSRSKDADDVVALDQWGFGHPAPGRCGADWSIST